jgi:hypothetical protein
MPEMVDTVELSSAVEQLRPPQGFLKQTYFGGTPILFDTLEVELQKRDRRRRVSPLVLPTVEGQVVQSRAFAAERYKPAYIKDKRHLQPRNFTTRAFGEAPTANLSAADRLQIAIDDEMLDQRNMWELRLELMCAQLMTTGTITLTGEKYPTTVIDFQRNALLRPSALIAGTQWGAAGVSIRGYLSTRSKVLSDVGGVSPKDVVMGLDAWEVFSADTTVRAVLDIRNAVQSPFDIGAQIGEGATYRGEIFGYRIWTYYGTFIDPITNAQQEIMPAKGCIIGSPDTVQGYVAFGAIEDVATMRAQPFFVKMYEEDDPSALMLLFQSAPMPLAGWIDGASFQQVLV